MNTSEDKQPKKDLIAYYALFEAHPSSNPPFSIYLGMDQGRSDTLKDCKNIPDGGNRIKEYCAQNTVQYSTDFTLIYPIYMDAMGSDFEGAMHQIAWLIKDLADANQWKFDRTGGLTGKTTKNFLP